MTGDTTGRPLAVPPKIEFRNVELHYFSTKGETHAVSDMNFTVNKGEFISIVGQSGCGKSTLLSLLCGLMQTTSGQVLIDGKPVKGPSPQVGFMLQHDSLFEWRTILENALLGPEIRGMDMPAARARAERILTNYGLGQFLHHRPTQLSGGMRQRAALGRTMCMEPDILLLDEPFSALDFQTRMSISEEIGEIIRREGKTAILVTHDIPEAIAMADRVIVLSPRPGRLKNIHEITFPSLGEVRPGCMAVRDAEEFKDYFHTIWTEMESDG
ncbi:MULTISPECIES: ABC transporter ATP-binding protein [Roseobacteraceae]|uniref:Taurine ABC superfamily ATP binding cassette transporter, ABC protein n=1 Tax=Celeribacter baekdonensis B30 TaxID=1208323 RepID=K2K1D8_9RHOB|nr:MULTISPECIES: ABC transporter ATP-binding protein [Roseobacteraceae]EKE71265.1 taurine ABC superfamily ATP binding cassette transporter, ABC protein [Celeribacter baekdonensis B30]KAB6716974.1 ABC transporter ATP-binding protein [Roseobacter sp. TSBP12]|tara:strand:+ start:5144 stop:5953 length:810 start_codon:yes stop_codon:yes gene_type:complete